MCRWSRSSRFRSRCRTVFALAGVVFLPSSADAVPEQPDVRKPRGDFDLRGAAVAPAAGAVAAVAALGGAASRIRFGTVRTLHRDGEFLSAVLAGAPEEAARSWIAGRVALFGRAPGSASRQRRVRDSRLAGSSARVLLFGRTVAGVGTSRRRPFTLPSTSARRGEPEALATELLLLSTSGSASLAGAKKGENR